jgi:hypothetical protein
LASGAAAWRFWVVVAGEVGSTVDCWCARAQNAAMPLPGPTARRGRRAALLTLAAAFGMALFSSCANEAGEGRHGVAAAAAPACAPPPAAQTAPDDPSFALAPIALCGAGQRRASEDPHQVDLGSFIPHGSRLRQVWFLQGGGLADQVLVEWVAQRRPAIDRGGFPATLRWGLTVWQRTNAGSGLETVWDGAVIPVLRTPPAPEDLNLTVGDVTGDRHPDVLIAQYPDTNHGCGPHQVIAALPGGRQWRVFGGAPLCETTMTGSRGLLKIVAPIYRRGDSVCCPSLMETTYRRWSGTRYRVVRKRFTRPHD